MGPENVSWRNVIKFYICDWACKNITVNKKEVYHTKNCLVQ